MRPRPDFMSDDDLDSVPDGESLVAAYDLVVFAGHEEYVTSHVYDVVKRYRDLGGNIAFLSSNTFFYGFAGRNRDFGGWSGGSNIGRVDARLTGVHSSAGRASGSANRPYVATNVSLAPSGLPWHGLREVESFGSSYALRSTRSRPTPPRHSLLARIPAFSGGASSATMTFYELQAREGVSPQAT